MTKTARKQSRFARVVFKLGVRITTASESTTAPVPISVPIIEDDGIDVSKINLAEYIVGENRDQQEDKKNAKAAKAPTEKLDPMKQYMEELSRIPLITKEQEAMLAEQIHSGDKKLHDEVYL